MASWSQGAFPGAEVNFKARDLNAGVANLVRLRALRLRHYRAFEDAHLDLDDVTFLVGRNGAGKSTLMDALSFMSEAITDSLATALERRGNLEGIRQRQSGKGPRFDVSLAIRFDLKKVDRDGVPPIPMPMVYGFRLGPVRKATSYVVKQEYCRGPEGLPWFERSGEKFLSNRHDVGPALDSSSLLLPRLVGSNLAWSYAQIALRRISVHQFSPNVLRAEPEIGSQERLARDGGNSGDVLKNLKPADRAWIVEHLTRITPGIRGIEATARAGRRVIVFHQDGPGGSKQSHDASMMSDGTLRSLGILLALRQTPRPSVVLLDEIEDSLHPRAREVLLDAVQESSKEFPVVVSTHDPEILSHPTATPDRIRIVQWDKGSSAIYRLSKEVRGGLKPPQTVGRLLRSNALWTEESPETTGGAADFFQVS